jgi:multiple sugar transport system substrate-binding protein
MMQAGQAALVMSWDEFFPGLDSDESKVKGLWEPAKPLNASPALRPAAEAGFGEIPNVGHQGGSVMALSKYSKNQDAAWLFMQWACSKDVMTRCTLIGGFAPMRISSFTDPRVKEKARVGPGTTRHLETVKWTIDNVMGSEPDMPLWAGFSNNEIPTELGKLLTGQAYGGDAKACMDAVAGMIDTQVKDAGLL